MSDSKLITEQTALPAEGQVPAVPARAARPGLALGRLSLAGVLFDLLLIALIVVGVFFRFSWTNWNENADLHPDEYGLTQTITQLRIPDSFGEYLNTRISPISPYQKYDEFGNALPRSAEYPVPDNRMRWGQWPIIIIRYAAELTGNTEYRDLRLMGRQLSALADTLALGVIFLIGWRLYGRRVGLLAAALSALAVMQIQQSHFMTADNLAVLFTALAMYAAVRAAQETRSGAEAPEAREPANLTPAENGQLPAEDGARPASYDGAEPANSGDITRSSTTRSSPGWLWYAVFGVFFGMALASRINLAPLFGEIFVAAVIAFVPQWTRGRKDVLSLATDIGLRLALAGAVAFLTFRVTQPMSFRAELGDTTLFTLNPNPEWVESMKVAQAESSGVGGGPPGEQWTDRPALVFPWINMVVWGMGLPLGLLAWAGLAWAAWRSIRDDDELSWQQHALPLSWAGGYFLFMGTRWVKSIRYFLPIYPFMALFAAWALVELWRLGRQPEARRRLLEVRERGGPALASRLRPLAPKLALVLGAVVLLGTLAWAWGFTSIYRNTNTRVAATRWVYQNIPAPLTLHIQTAEGEYREPLPVPDGLAIGAEAPYIIPFTARVSGTVNNVSAAYAGSPYDPQGDGTLRVVLARDTGGSQVLGQADIYVPPAPEDEPRGVPVAGAFGPAEVQEGETYYVLVSTSAGGPIELHTTVIAHEEWDEPLPVRMDGRDPFGGLYRGVNMLVRGFENEDKRQMFLNNLAQVDYIIVPSQRGLWSASRLPNTYPMTMEYYRALFDGRLGFEQVAEFQSPITIGPLQVSDAAGTWAWGEAPPLPPPGEHYPFNNNPLAAEEAFSVYDHAPVWVFKKRPDFSLEQAAAILNAIDLSQVVAQGPRDYTLVPHLLRLPPERLAELRAGGTWSAMFDFDGLLNRYQWLGTVVWYLALLGIGWLAVPLAFVTFRGLSDRGYTLAKTVALLVVTWLVWVWGSYRLLPHTRGTIALGFLLLGLVSAVIYWRRRAEFHTFLRAHRRYILVVEGLGLSLFVFDLLIRLGNPDLWHWWFGGEKPMVFSFFNAVLKSESFPPYNPWLSGHFLNYYYYGFVIVGLLTKLLGIVPAIAYNLILPTLFSLTGVNAFGVAYNLVARDRRRIEAEVAETSLAEDPDDENPAIIEDPVPGNEAQAAEIVEADLVASPGVSPDTGLAAGQADVAQSPDTARPRPFAPPRLRADRPSAYLAGLTAALMIVVLGNLGQVHLFLDAFQGAADQAALQNSLLGNGELGQTLNGLWRVLTGEAQLRISTGDYYWHASRIVDYLTEGTPEVADGREITEFPFFTFLYADLHAHMIDLPFTVLSLGWAVSYLLGARLRRGWLEWVPVWAIGGLALGVPRAANTWDFPLFLALGLMAVVVGQWLRDPRLTRGNLVAVGGRMLLLGALAFALYRPFDQWFAAAYSDLERWKGTHASLSGYLYVHGLFLFILVSFLVWETRRWLAETPATVLNQAGEWLPVAVMLVFGVVLGVGVLWMLDVPAGLIALPLMAWAGLLLLRDWDDITIPRRIVLFMLGTALAVTLFVELFVLEGDRMNTIFKFYIQVWVLLSVAAGAALAWVWATLPEWHPTWRGTWASAVVLLFGAAALYTATATAAKIDDRFPSRAVDIVNPESDCKPIPGLALPYEQGLPPDEQPNSLYGLEYMTYSAYCDRGYFLPLAYDHDAIRWLQDNVVGSPVIVEAQTFDLYRMSSRYAWNTGLPNIVGWDWHTRQHNAAIPTGFVTERGQEITNFYTTPVPAEARAFIDKYDVGYVIVGPMELAFYQSTGGLDKFDALVSSGDLTIAYRNPGVTIYAVAPAVASQ